MIDPRDNTDIRNSAWWRGSILRRPLLACLDCPDVTTKCWLATMGAGVLMVGYFYGAMWLTVGLLWLLGKVF